MTRKNGEKLFFAQNCLNRIMSQLLDYTQKLTKIERKNRKIIFGSELSETNNDFRLHKTQNHKPQHVVLSI